ncbi:MAG TPA: tetratricopeptide repeat protein [Blastocatellia bacterium]|nr:tetratricopeptide repeat protein [Blastocatellia bacterium]
MPDPINAFEPVSASTSSALAVDEASSQTSKPEFIRAKINLDFTSARVIIPVLVLLTLIAFASSISGDFVHDDLPQICDNHTFGHWDTATITRIFTHDFWASLRPELAGDKLDSLYYRPIFSLFLMLGYEVAGLSAPGWHLIALLLHIVVAVLAFYVIKLSLDAVGVVEEKEKRILAAFAAGFFVVHPAQAESVAWISGLVGPLSTIFLLGAFYFYVRYRTHASLWTTLAIILLFALSVLTKESACAAILMVPAYEFFVFKNNHNIISRLKAAFVQALPFALVVFGYIALRYSVLNVLFGRSLNLNFPDDASLTLADNLRTLPALVIAYAKLVFLPTDLSLMYDFGYVRSLGFASFWMPLLVLLVASVALIRFSQRVPAVKLALIWMVLPLLSHLNTRAFVSDEIIHDRYLYLSILGAGLLIAISMVQATKSSWLRLPAKSATCAAVIILLVLSLLTSVQNKRYQNGEVLWRDMAAHAPNSRIARIGLGLLAESKQDPVGALREYEAALKLNPDIIDALNNSAFVYARSGHWPEATRNFERIISLTPDKAAAHFNLSFAYSVQKRYAEALSEQRIAIELDPNGKRADEWRMRLEQLEKQQQAVSSN